ncbi:MAG TPA: SDR family oxidoreductase [Bryobacterales bacterium]|nr:SDR family oxidoreductase [Bryobacterales bacterium]
MADNRILVVGGAGYVGSVLTSELLERGYAVKVLDRLYYGEEGLLDVRDRVEIVAADMRALPAAALDDVEAVINLGGLSNDPTAEYNPRANHEMNTTASIKLAEACIARGVRRYLFASSCSIYDRGVGNDENDVIQDEASEVAPKAAYSASKYAAERALLEMASSKFCPVILRKGTIYGFSPRMRYDLVVNTFVKDALSKGFLTLHYGGAMWRPLVDVHDVARAYIACLAADESKIGGQIFNLCYRNFRVSELALEVRAALKEAGLDCDIRVDYGYKGVRSYRVSSQKLERALGVHPVVTVGEAAKDMVEKIRRYRYTDFDNPKYYNIRWMKMLEEAHKVIRVTGSVFGVGDGPA